MIARTGARGLFAKLSPCVGLALLSIAVCAPSAQADFGLKPGLEGFDLAFEGEDGSAALQAGEHPFAMSTTLNFNTTEGEREGEPAEVPVEDPKDLTVTLPPGLVGDPAATPPCSDLEFLQSGSCPKSTTLGTVDVVTFGDEHSTDRVFNLAPPAGAVQKLGFYAKGLVPVTITVRLSPNPPYNVVAKLSNIANVLPVTGSKLTLWGVPAAHSHDAQRGGPAGVAEVPFLAAPRACTGPLATAFAIDSWQHPGALTPSGEPDPEDPNWLTGSALTHDDSEPPVPTGFIACGSLGFNPSIAAQPTTKAASSPSGLDFSLDVEDPNLLSPKPEARAASDIRKALVTLPEGMSANPSLAEGLAVCTEAQLAKETAFSAPGEGCPQESKIGSVEVETPLLEEDVDGSLFVAKPYDNPFDSLLALYIVLKNPQLGISITQPLKVESDPQTGQLTTLAEELPQLPFSHFRLHFRQGTRSPLASPPACGTHTVRATLYPWSGGPPLQTTSAFEILTGPDEGPCPTGGLPPFHPGLDAGTLNNAAGHFSPFDLRLHRSDTEQEITHFSIKLPPGIAARLAGVPFCPDPAIAAAKARSGPHGGAEELASPSCPAASLIGRTLVGAGVGPSLAYAPGRLYLAGPYHGAPISIVAITAGVVGPFDLGTVVVREGLKLNPETGEAFIDATGSDPIPHIIAGIPVHLRDVRVYTDRPEFVLNPTSCEPTSTASTVLGAGLDFASEADDNPFTATSRFQAADCAALPFKPKLTLALKGSHRRAGNPALHAHLTMAGMGATGANEAGLAYSQVALPPTLFLDNAHIGLPCTRVQFKEGAVEGEKCPASSVIGSAKAVTPILSEPLEGPIYLRSNPERQLPDIAAALQGSEIHVVAVGHTDSAPGGGLRNTFEVIPDAPIASVDIDLFGGHRGLIENSADICAHPKKAKVKFTGHNGRRYDHKIPIKASGCGKRNKHHKRRRQAG